MAGKRRGNGEGTVWYDAARGRWTAQRHVRTLDGTLKRITARGRTKIAALDALRARAREVTGMSAAAGRMTVESFLLAWLDHKRASVKARTHREYRQVITQHVLPVIGPLALAKLTPAHVQRVVDRLAVQGKRATAFNCRRYLKSAFEQGRQWQYLSSNPVVGVSKVRVPEPKRGLWTVDQVARFLAFTNARTRYHALFLTAVTTGLRQGELVALPWAHVTRERITVDRTWSKDDIVGYDTPKTQKAYRSVPVSEDVYHAIVLARGRYAGPLAFPSEVGTMLLPWNVHRAFVHWWRAYNAQAPEGLDLPRIRYHDLRRVAATLWARQGVEPRVIQQLLGHATPHLALSVYQGVLDERVDAARLDAWMLFGGNAVGDGLTRAVEREGTGAVGGVLPN